MCERCGIVQRDLSALCVSAEFGQLPLLLFAFFDTESSTRLEASLIACDGAR